VINDNACSTVAQEVAIKEVVKDEPKRKSKKQLKKVEPQANNILG